MRRESSIEKGDAFRDAVAALLSTKYENVRTEVLLVHKKVDVVFAEHSFGADATTVVEAKCYSSPLKTADLEKIITSYQPLINERAADYLLIVAPEEIGALPKTYLDSWRWARFRTFQQLEEEILGIRNVILSQESLFEEDGLSHYYQETRFGDGQNLYEYIREWINEPSSPPIAILGGYGMGKTSFAKRLVAELSKDHLSNQARRIPILVKLGDIISQQDIEGLFGKLFTARYRTSRGYNFSTLMHLNESGRLVIVMDGFDEMKHAMRMSDFRATFKDLNRLVVTNSKVILLGRPNAFDSEGERSLLLQGVRSAGGQWVKEPGAPSYRELELCRFTDEDALNFIERYLRYQLSRESSSVTEEAEQFVQNRLSEVRALNFQDLISRPVQAKILTDLASDPKVVLKKFTRYQLYDEFIHAVLRRDEEKKARMPIGAISRREFLRRLCWWLWTQHSGRLSFQSTECSQTLFDGLPIGDADTHEEIRREYFVSALLEAKAGGVFYLPHRSFVEFLVAEHARSLSPGQGEHSTLSTALSDDVRQFIEESGDFEFLKNWYSTLPGASGPISLNYLRFFRHADLPSEADEVALRAWLPWELGVRAYQQGDGDGVFTENSLRLIISAMKSGRSDTAIFAVLLILSAGGLTSSAKVADQLPLIAAVLVERVFGQVEGTSSSGVPIINAKSAGAFLSILKRAFSKTRDENGRPIILINWREVVNAAITFLTRHTRFSLDTYVEHSAIPDTSRIRLEEIRPLIAGVANGQFVRFVSSKKEFRELVAKEVVSSR